MINEIEGRNDFSTSIKNSWCIVERNYRQTYFRHKFFLPENEINPTKRNVLSTICSFYDPLGIFQQLIVSSKILFQELCRSNLDWDDVFPTQMTEKWNVIVSEIKSLPPFELSRKYFESIPHSLNLVRHELHGYSDARPAAYGAVVYLIKKENSSFNRP